MRFAISGIPSYGSSISISKKILNVFHAIGRGIGFMLSLIGSVGMGMTQSMAESSKEIQKKNDARPKEKEDEYEVTFMPTGFRK